MKIVTIIGARPQFIKAAVVSNALRSMAGVKEILIHTGQHFDDNMSQVFFDDLEIPKPEYNLGIFGGMHGAQTGRMLESIENVLLQEKPNVVLVYGDTNSTLAGALAATKLHIPVAHVEAGLRSFNRRMPEEINRIVSDHISDILFVPTSTGIKNLQKEGVSEQKLYLVGDVMYDAALHFGRKAERTSSILDQLKISTNRYILATIHRAENTDTPHLIHAILDGLMQVAHDIPVIFPMHPRTRNVIDGDINLLKLANTLHIIDPVGYLDMIMLEKNARLIATDSGGVQKEAFFYGVPCVTLRNETEWVELVDLNWNILSSPAGGSANIAATIRTRLGIMGKDSKPYGDGKAAEKIATILSDHK